MKSAARLFYLSVFALWAPAQCQNLDATSQDACVISPQAIVDDACASYSTLERINRNVKPALDDLTRTTDFFSHYRVNLFHKKCPFWNDENGMCGNVACAVETLDNEDDIPPIWRASALGKLEGPRAHHPGRSLQLNEPRRPLRGVLGEDVGESCVVEYDDECDQRDYCVPEDESASSKGDYVSLLRNPERFTGYAGDGAKQVWDAIYRENCFKRSSFPGGSAGPGEGTSPKGPAAHDFRAVIEAAGRQQILAVSRQHNPLTPFVSNTGLEHDDECLEKRVFYRVISGMHASISTHLCWDFLNQTTGQWQPNLACYVGRLHRHPDRIRNLYFNYALLTRAVAKLGPYLSRRGDYTFCLGEPAQDEATRAKVLDVASRAASVPDIFDESLMFKNGEGPSLKEDFRNRFRNVSRLMDCVGCDKCRLWGKLQTRGYGTALKVLFEFDNLDPARLTDDAPAPIVLKRTELVALFNTYARLSNSLMAVQEFRRMVKETEAEYKADKKAREAETAKAISAEVAGNAQKTAAGSASSSSSSLPSSSSSSSSSASSTTTADKVMKGITPAPASSSLSGSTDEAEESEQLGDQPWSIGDDLDEELGKIIKVVKYVLESWVRFPFVLWRIVTSELKRLWQFYIGLPVSPRAWMWYLPRVDEL
ncbi:hypothetical protein VTJ83DRAFT_411 [Remersonia thermophila]|uniref:Endoplasmic oxidoreductin-1 n=1 Tax=Remersonia thermophila TaxID=72144 RepID=A0ABR4DKW6_9PEZI